jgi:hypothetical protein
MTMRRLGGWASWGFVLACSSTGPGELGQDDGSGIASVDDDGSGAIDSGTSATGDATADASDGPVGGDSTGALKFDIASDGDVAGCGAGDGEDQESEAEFSYIWIGNSPEGTVSKVDTETGVELGRYRTSAGLDSPSRTSVNQFGDVAVGNRGPNGSITKIAARLEDCVESNGVAGIQTSAGPGDILAWGQDECVLWNAPMPVNDYARGPRGVAWEGGEIDPQTCTNTVPNPRLWISWRGDGNTIEIRRLDGATGAILDTTSALGGGGRTYGGAVNGEGDFWIATRGGVDNLIHVDSVTLVTTVFDVPSGDNYGMAVDADGDPWVVGYNDGANHIYRLDVATGTFVDVGSGGRYRGVQADREGRVWIAGNAPCRLALADAATDTLVDDAIAVPGCVTPVGISIDWQGFVWMVDQGASKAFKIDPTTHAVVLTVEGLDHPYTYSDMTGAGLDLVVNPPG